MNRLFATKALLEWGRRRARRRRLNLSKLTFGKQRAFVLDGRPYVAASCSRQAGKSYGIGIKLLDRGFRYPGKTCLYVTNTRPQARNIMWPVLEELDRVHKLGGKFHEVRQTYTLPNGAVIQLGGANDKIEIERYRGPQYPLVVVDEAQSIRPFIRQLVYQILRPGQAKYPDRQILLCGTPNAARSGFLYKVATGEEEGWSLHHWTIRDNPWIPDVDAFLAEERRTRKLKETDAAYLREFCGQWVRDAASQVYKITDRNLIDAFPTSAGWRFVLGVDLGFVHTSAYCVCGYNIRERKVIVAESYQKRVPDGIDMLTPAMVVAEIEAIRVRYDIAETVVDPGGLGARFAQAIRRRWGIPVFAAEKADKMPAIYLLNGDLRTGHVELVAHTNEDLIFDAENLEYRWDAVDAERYGGEINRSDLLIDDRTPDHLTDALTYAYRRCRHYIYDGDEPSHPPIGSAAYEEWAESQREAKELREPIPGETDWMDEDLPVADPLGLG